MSEQGRILVRGTRVHLPEPTDHDAVLVEGDRIAAVGSAAALAEEAGLAAADVLDVRPYEIAPGLIDTHVHITGSGLPSAPVERKVEPLEMHLLRAAGNAARALQEGLTTVRDCGARNDAIFPFRRAVEAGALQAPRLLTSGSALTRTGGHGHWWGGEADTDDEVRRVIRRQGKLGAECIKVMVDGGLDGGGRARPGLLMFTAAELSAVVAEATDWGLPVIAHCLTSAAIRVATEAHVHSIEHAIFYDPQRGEPDYDSGVVDEIAAKGIWVNPGQTFAYQAISRPAQDERFRRNAEMFWIRLKHDAAMLAAGVRMVTGTDAGTYATPFGSYALGPRLFVDPIGMTPLQALRTCTSDAAAAIGMAGQIGAIVAGSHADLVAVDGDLERDITALERVRLTMVGGSVVFDGRGRTGVAEGGAAEGN
jgi:imidazolonepropionase-like amidohydrolase